MSQPTDTRVRLDRLADDLSPNGQVQTTTFHKAMDGIEVPKSLPDWYVYPNLALDGEILRGRVLLVDAAGAVGKSAAATAFSAILGWPLVHTERAQVGSFSLSGIIQESMGIDSDFLARVSSGTSGLVIDALDEALMRAGSDNFFAYMDNIASVAASIRSEKPGIILLSRTETADLVADHLSEKDVAFIRSRLDFFGKAEAEQYVRKYMRRRHSETSDAKYNAAMSHPAIFDKLLRKRMVGLGKLVAPNSDIRQEWRDFEDFLGYAPVLDAVAESVAVTNPALELSAGSNGSSSQFLRKVLSDILVREQSKVESGLIEKLRVTLSPGLDMASVENLYSPDEQVSRLAARAAGVEVSVELPASLPSELGATYRDAVEMFLSDHPFMRGKDFASVVFADYVIACAESPAALVSVDRQSASPRVGPFYCRFLAPAEADTHTSIDEKVIARLLASWRAESDVVQAQGFAIFSAGDGECRLTLVRGDMAHGDRGGFAADPLEFRVSNFSSLLELKSPIANISVVGNMGVHFSSDSEELILGDHVVVVVDEVEVDAKSIRVASNDEAPAILVAFSELKANRLERVGGSEALKISSPDSPGRLRSYTFEVESGHRMVTYSQYVDLRAILLSFGRSAAGDPAVYYEKIDQAIVKDNSSRRALFQYLVDRGVIYRDEQLYRLRRDSLSALGFGVSEIYRGEPGPAVLEFLAGIPGNAE
ncbi:hypothetical protein GCM10027055_06080 [Janibacter alkaliphilus]|uniref:Uncharacterized protein n=1 Tax=Janibacter alkaliphilus TaxID=1069963 RepID=A0A852X1M8_9MICO|nr:hypothetical protein [Janibacter alkaliphilus]NYG37222.1 hypothetical protein [Janibacter alkaliphilus]